MITLLDNLGIAIPPFLGGVVFIKKLHESSALQLAPLEFFSRPICVYLNLISFVPAYRGIEFLKDILKCCRPDVGRVEMGLGRKLDGIHKTLIVDSDIELRLLMENSSRSSVLPLLRESLKCFSSWRVWSYHCWSRGYDVKKLWNAWLHVWMLFLVFLRMTLHLIKIT